MFISLIFIFFKLNKKLNRGNIYNASKYIYYILDHKEQSFFGATSFITVVDARASFVKKTGLSASTSNKKNYRQHVKYMNISRFGKKSNRIADNNNIIK